MAPALLPAAAVAPVVLDALAEVGVRFWGVLCQMAPYLLFGFLVAGILSVLVSAARVERHLGRRGIGSIVKAAAFGVPLPLCSCGVIPVTASLRRHGASPGATTAFLLSTPQTGVDSILVTLGLLGPVFAIFRPLAALATGIVGGVLILLFGPGRGKEKKPQACTETCCSDAGRGGKLRRALAYGFVDLPRDIGRPLLIGLVVAGVISALVPQDWFAGRLGTGIVPMLVMMAAGIPVYVCATASVPIAAALVSAGLSPGAALVFLMTGPATNAAALATVWKLLGLRATGLILGTVAGSSLACGLLLDHIFAVVPAAQPARMHEMLPDAVGIASAVVLLTVLGVALLPRRRKVEPAPPAEEEEHLGIRIQGMTCSHCAAMVRRALLECAGVTEADVSLEDGRADVRGSGLEAEPLRRAVEDLGYTVTDTSEPYFRAS